MLDPQGQLKGWAIKTVIGIRQFCCEIIVADAPLQFIISTKNGPL